jgi:hypothetical protein
VYDGGYNLYTLDTTTGAATEIGTAGSPGVPTGALLWDGSTSTLFAGKTSPGTDTVDTLSISTGAATVGATLTGTGTGDQFNGLAPIPTTSAVPEPANVSYLVFGLLAVGGWIQTRRNRSSKRQPE